MSNLQEQPKPKTQDKQQALLEIMLDHLAKELEDLTMIEMNIKAGLQRIARTPYPEEEKALSKIVEDSLIERLGQKIDYLAKLNYELRISANKLEDLI